MAAMSSVDTAPSFKLRAAELRDVQAIVGLIRELAEFEQLTHLLQVTPEKLRPHLFGEKPVAEALVAEQGGEVGHIVYCPHGPDEGCDCRKPKPGMLRAIAEHYQIGLEGVWFVGDSKGDLEAALAVGAQPVLVKTGKGERTLEKGVPETTLIFDDLAAIARELI